MHNRTTIELIQDLCGKLETAKIPYCHWKSNAMLDRSASGANDLDLLVSRTDSQRFTTLLYELGFRKGLAVPELRTPGIEHFYGYDAATGDLVHVHAHYQLIVGSDLLKHHRLRAERQFLQSAVQEGVFRVPVVELEFIVFVIRMVLKRPIIYPGVRSRLSSSAREEYEYLLSHSDPEQVTLILHNDFPYLDLNLFNACVRSLERTASPWERAVTAWQLRHAMRAVRCRGGVEAFVLRIYHRVALPLRSRVFKLSSKKRLINGGLLIAVVGGDGAGKSTAVSGLYGWLARTFDVEAVHMGKPRRSALTFVVDNIMRANHLIERMVRGAKKPDYWDRPAASGHLSLLDAVRCVCTARDRFRAYTRMQRFTSNGGIVICDRYPIPQIRRMDARRLEHRESEQSSLYRSLVNLEQEYYDQILPPDLLIVLRVSPDVAVRRKTEESASSVRMRSQEVWNLDWEQTVAHVVDASSPQTEVLANLKSLIWSCL